jgi:DeoR family transcriptional regulator of aga operon
MDHVLTQEQSMSTKIDARAKAIMRVLVRDEDISVDSLVQEVGTCATNIRRDLARLEQRGLVLRTRGGATLSAPLLYKAYRYDDSIHGRQLQFAEQKRRIGLVASELIGKGETVGITAGTTTTQIGRALRHRQGISVVTNALNIAMELSHQSAIKTTLTGGILAKKSKFALVSESAISAIKAVFLEKVFVGVTGIDLFCGATIIDLEEANIAKVMIAQSSQVIVVADSSKVNRVSTVCICPCSTIDILVTDSGISKDLCESFLANGIKVVCA